ncbi:MAG: glycosyltransferase, partial [Elusimicrobia bacterium]|nr:glycosyltransferase [Elusimicrobiota bacterium]MBD3412741.1 glycosyltransferase [Elusimicrobiota bacterium]
MKKKIIFCIDGSEYGGGQRSFVQLALGLKREQYEPSIVSTANSHIEKLISSSDIRFIPIDFSSQIKPWLIHRLKTLFHSMQPDLVHTQGARMDFYARMAARAARVPVICSTIAMPVEFFNVNPLRKIVYRIFDRWSRRHVNHFIAVSEVLKNHLIFVQNVQRDTISVIYNGVETDIYNTKDFNPETEKKALGFDGNETVIGSVGRLIYQKSFDVFISAASRVKQVHPDVKFVLAGEGPLRQDLEK